LSKEAIDNNLAIWPRPNAEFATDAAEISSVRTMKSRQECLSQKGESHALTFSSPFRQGQVAAPQLSGNTELGFEYILI
jgi:hypothetical protein